MVSHANVLHYVEYVTKRYGLTSNDRVSQTFDITFDLSEHDMFVAWDRPGVTPSSASAEVLFMLFRAVKSSVSRIALRCSSALHCSLVCDRPRPCYRRAVMRDAAANYGGPHKVVLNCNPKKVGLAEHVNRVAGLANGDLVVTAAGDDISLPERPALSAESWELSGRQTTSIHGRFVVIDEAGRLTGEESRVTWPATKAVHLRQTVKPVDFVRTLRPSVYGSCHAFARRLFTDFGPLPAYLEYEDLGLAFRSALLGEITYVDRVFVKYRRHSRNTCALWIENSPLGTGAVKTADQISAYHQAVARECVRFVRLYDCFERDVKTLVQREKLDLQTATRLE
jgi:hypothetical protein